MIRREAEGGEDSVSVTITTFTCAQAARLLKEIRLRQEIRDDADMHRSSSVTVKLNAVMHLISRHIPCKPHSHTCEPRLSYFNLIRDMYSAAAEFLAFELIFFFKERCGFGV